MMFLAVVGFLSLPLAVQESVEEKLKPSVVRIGNEECSGSGMFLDADGLILTNAHVACSPLPFKVGAFAKVRGTYKEVTFRKVTLLGFHPEYDLALLRIDPSECDATVKPVTIASGPPLGRERVWAIGFPGDYQHGKMKVATWGEMRSTNKDFYGMSYYEMDISVTHGNSGGPLCNNAGQVLGVVSAIAPDGNALAVPISAMKRERFGALKDRVPNKEVSTLIQGWAEEELKATKGPPSEQAMMLYETALLWDNGNAAMYSRVGQLNQQAGRSSAAVAYLTRSLQMQPWAEKAETYRSLGLALMALGKPEEALTMWKEGLEKYPLDNALLWGDFASFLEKRKRYPEAALSARLALRTYSPRADEMNQIYKRAHAQMSSADLDALRSQEGDLDNHLGRMRSAADKARREGRLYMSPDAEKVVATMTGVQVEVAAASPARAEPGRPQPLRISDEELDIRFIRGRVDVAKEHLRNGRQDKAIEILEDVIASYPRHPETETARLALKLIRRN